MQMKKKGIKHIYIKPPNSVAIKSGTSASSVCLGGEIIAAPDPIPLVVYMYWKLMSLELKQLSRVTVSFISGSCGSANSISTHCERYVVSLKSCQKIKNGVKEDIHCTTQHHASQSPPLESWPCRRCLQRYWPVMGLVASKWYQGRDHLLVQ